MTKIRADRLGLLGSGLLLALLLAAGCGPPAASDDGPRQVVAGFYPLEEAARRVGGEAVEVHNLTPPGAEPHDLELSVGDVRLIRRADLIVYLSGGFQPALEEAAAVAPGKSLDALAGMELLAGQGHDEEGEHEEEEQAGEGAEPPPQDEAADGEALDPHLWLDPVLFTRVVDEIADALGELDPEQAGAFRERARDYALKLEELDEQFRQGLASCESRLLVTNHAAFGYLAARYDLEQIAISGLSTEAQPTPRKLEEIIELVRLREVRAVYVEPLASPRVAETVARETGVPTLVLNPLEGLTPEELARGEDYLSVMRANLEALQEGLGCS